MNKTAKNVGIILGCSVVAKVLSYIWEAVLAAYLGASDQADALYMTTSISGILFPILDLGIWKVFLPIYKRKLVEQDEKKAEYIANVAVTLFFLLSFALVLFLVFFSNPLVSVMAPGFAGEKKELTIEFLRISAPSYFLMAVASIIGAMLQSREKFLGSQIREIGTHLSKILYFFVCYRFFGIYTAVTAMIVGSIFRVLIQLPFIHWKWKLRPNFHFRDPEIVPMIKGLPSVAITAAIAHINGTIDKIIASGAGSGAVACLNYGHKLMNVFSGMISTAISTAVYPTIIQYVAEDRKEKLKELLHNVFSALGFIIIPISVYCVLFSRELVTAAFQRGAFDDFAAELTSGVFTGYCIGMLFSGLATIVTNVFYAYGDTKITMHISIVQIVLNIIFDFAFLHFFGVAGLATATSVSAFLCLILRIYRLKKFIRLDLKPILTDGIKVLAFSFLACLIPYFLITQLKTHAILSILVSFVFSAALYFLLAKLFRLPSMHFLASMIKKKRSKTAPKNGEGPQ